MISTACFVANLYDKRTQALGEYFEDDWSRIEPVSVEPGHQAEWCWLLKGFERITGCPTGRPAVNCWPRRCATGTRRRAAWSMRATPTATSGATRDGCGRKPKWRRRGSRKPKSGEEGAADEARAALARLARHYLNHPVAGAWYDQFDGEGRSLVATIPASSFYHVLCAVAEAEQVMG